MRNLLNIKKYSKDLLRLLSTIKLNQNGVEIYFDRTSDVLSTGASRSEVLETFKKDVDKTATDLVKTQSVINSIKNGKVIEIDSMYNSVEDVFGNCFDKNNNTIKISGVVFNAGPGNAYKKSDLSEMILKNLFNIDKKELNRVLKALDKYESVEDDIEKAILYPSTVLADEIIQKILKENVKFESFRKSMNFEEKAEFDISFRRTGVTGVIQNSTYIDSKGIRQLAKSHKRLHAMKLENMLIGGLKYIDAVEIDGNGSLEKMTHLVKQVEKLTLNTGKKFTLKARKLGNLKAKGVYFENQCIVAEDVRDTSALLHEIGHHIHITTLRDNNFVNYMIDKLTPLVNFKDEETLSFVDYYLNPKEVIARACEIAGLFAREEGKLRIDDSDFEIIKSRETYMSRKGIYFGFNTFDEETKKEFLALFELFFKTAPNSIEKSYDNFIKQKSFYKREEKKINFFDFLEKKVKKEQKALYSLVNSKTIETIFAHRGNVSFVELAQTLLLNLYYWGANKDRMTVKEWRETIEDKAGVFLYIMEYVRTHLSKRDWIEFLEAFKKKAWSRVKREIFFQGFSPKFSMLLRKEFRENDTPNYDSVVEYKAYLQKSSLSLLDEELLKDEDLVKSLLDKYPNAISDIKAEMIDEDLLIQYNKYVVAELEKDHLKVTYLHIHPALTANAVFMQDIAENHPNIISYADKKLLNDKKFMSYYINKYGYEYLCNIGDELKNDVDFAKEMTKIDKYYLIYFSSEVKNKLTIKKSKSSKKQDYEALIENGKVVDFERTDGKGVVKVLKIKEKINDFKDFNAYMRKNHIGYYSRIARGFILYDEYVKNAA